VQPAGQDANLVSTLNDSNGVGQTSGQSGTAFIASANALLVGPGNASQFQVTASGGEGMEREAGGGSAAETGPLRELPQPPSALMALPSVTISPSTLEPPSKPIDSPPTEATRADDRDGQPEEEQEQSEETATQVRDAIFKDLAGGDGAAEADASWVALAAAAFVGGAARAERRRRPPLAG
jgi:hypothetical protein